MKASISPPRLSRRRERFTRQKKNLLPSRFAVAGKSNDEPAPAPDEVPAGDLMFDLINYHDDACYFESALMRAS